MHRFTFVALLVSVCAALTGSSYAACGGGGWKTPATVTSTQSSGGTVVASTSGPATIVRDPSEPNYDAYFDAPRSKPLDSSKFDAVVAKLELSKEQSAKIDDARQAINKQVRELNRTKFTSERAFDACNGTCDAERTAMRKAIEAAQKYAATTEFETQLKAILAEKQLAVYDGKTPDVSTK